MDALTSMVEHHIWLTGEMIERAAGLTDDQLDAPISFSAAEDNKTLRRLLSRIVGQLDLWTHTMAGQRYDFSVEHGEDVAAMRERFADVAPSFLATVDDVVTSGRLDDTVDNTAREPYRTFTYSAMIQHVLTFAAHNRTLALLTLKQAGVTDLDMCISENVGTDCPVDASLVHVKRQHRTREA